VGSRTGLTLCVRYDHVGSKAALHCWRLEQADSKQCQYYRRDSTDNGKDAFCVLSRRPEAVHCHRYPDTTEIRVSDAGVYDEVTH
jgi:hypothetical protein